MICVFTNLVYYFLLFQTNTYIHNIWDVVSVKSEKCDKLDNSPFIADCM